MARSIIANRLGRLGLGAALSAVAATGAVAQTGAMPALPAGTRIRVMTPALKARGQIATVLGYHADTLVVRAEGRQDSTAIPFADVRRLQISRGSQTRITKGMLIGSVAGAVIGAVGSYATYKEDDCSQSFFFCDPISRSEVTEVGALLGAILGLGAGAGVGALWRAEQWMDLSLANGRVSLRLVPARGGVALSALF